MANNEAIYVSPELKKRLIREAVACGMTLDEYLAAHPGPQPPSSSENGNGHAQPEEDHSFLGGSSGSMKELKELFMMRALSNGQGIPGMTVDAGGGSNRELLARLDRIEGRLEARRAGPVEDDLGLDGIIRQSLRYRMMAPILRSIGGDEDSGGGNKALREYEKEMRDRVEKIQTQMLTEMRSKDQELARIRESNSEARIADMKDVVNGLKEEIGGLTSQLQNGPVSQQDSVATHLTEALQQASAVQTALDQIAKRGQPPPPTTGPQSTVETIAYLANELSGAVSKGLEAVARVNAAQRGHNPDAIGRMPPPGQPVPPYQPAYVDTPPQRQPAARPPARRAPPAPDTPTVGRGMRMPFEGARAPSPAPPPTQQPAAPADVPQMGPPPLDVRDLPPIDPRITLFQGVHNEPISRQDYQAMREQVYLQTGRDPLEVREVDTPPPTDAGAPSPSDAPPDESGGDTYIDGTSDQDPAQG